MQQTYIFANKTGWFVFFYNKSTRKKKPAHIWKLESKKEDEFPFFCRGGSCGIFFLPLLRKSPFWLRVNDCWVLLLYMVHTTSYKKTPFARLTKLKKESNAGRPLLFSFPLPDWLTVKETLWFKDKKKKINMHLPGECAAMRKDK